MAAPHCGHFDDDVDASFIPVPEEAEAEGYKDSANC
jgi:hypothetical protein